MQRVERCRSSEPCARGTHIKDIGFIFADLLNFLARVIGLNHKRCFCCLGRLEGEREASLTRKLPQESLTGALQPRFGIAGKRHRKRRVHSQAPGHRLRAPGKRHQIQCRLLSCGHHRVQQNAKNKYAKTLQPRILSHCPENPPTQGRNF